MEIKAFFSFTQKIVFKHMLCVSTGDRAVKGSKISQPKTWFFSILIILNWLFLKRSRQEALKT